MVHMVVLLILTLCDTGRHRGTGLNFFRGNEQEEILCSPQYEVEVCLLFDVDRVLVGLICYTFYRYYIFYVRTPDHTLKTTTPPRCTPQEHDVSPQQNTRRTSNLEVYPVCENRRDT